MTLIESIEQFKSVSFVGMEKNTGKTTCLNYVLSCLFEIGKRIALTSIGVDGEERDIIYDTPKPRIVLHPGMVFVTSEKDFEQREFPAEILSVSDRATPLGRLVTARACGSGRVVLSGPSDSVWLQEVMAELLGYGVELTLVDGALSRLSLASPTVTEAMILCTGAACSLQLHKVIDKTKFRYHLITLDQVEDRVLQELLPIEKSIWKWDETTAKWLKVGDSVFTTETFTGNVRRIFVGGAVTDRFLRMLCSTTYMPLDLIVRDFSKLFIEPATFKRFVLLGGTIKVLHKAVLLAVCTNPVSPTGASLDPKMLREQMQEALQVAVYDIMDRE
ncbi:MAG: hypothetical protein LBC84_02875 [Prevotellaceae bacterium]|jgi:hypothetical protein|nr:hypothetical protein [Prevotellaceae bacterium]